MTDTTWTYRPGFGWVERPARPVRVTFDIPRGTFTPPRHRVPWWAVGAIVALCAIVGAIVGARIVATVPTVPTGATVFEDGSWSLGTANGCTPGALCAQEVAR